MSFPFIPVLSAAAFCANLAVVLFLLPGRRAGAFVWPMIVLYLCLAGFNLGVALMVSADDPDRAYFFLFLMRPFLFSLGPAFFWTVSALLARPARVPVALLFTLAFALALTSGVEYLRGGDFFISGMRRFAWGYLPQAGPGAKIGLGAVFGLSVLPAFGLLTLAALRAGRLADGAVSARTVLILFALWWAGLFSNGLNLLGVSFFPLASLVDALMSFIITAVLHRRAPLDPRGRFLLRLAGALASVCPGLLVTWVLLEFILPAAPALTGLVGLITALVALGMFQWLFQPARERPPAPDASARDAAGADPPLFVRLQNEYRLTYQEARICEDLARGLPRAEIIRRLAISDGTFRNHLSEIYRKTIDPIDPPEKSSRDRWQRLTVFLHALEN